MRTLSKLIAAILGSVLLLGQATVLAASPSFSISFWPTSASIAQGKNAAIQIGYYPQNGYTGSVISTISNLPSGVTVSLVPSTPVAVTANGGVCTFTLLVSSSAAPGNYSLDVAGTDTVNSSIVTHKSFGLTITTTVQDFSLSTNPTSLSVVQGNSGTSTVKINPINGYSNTVTLAAINLPSGVDASFNPASTTTQTTLTLNVGAQATLGTSSITINGTDGTLTRSVSLNLTITAPPPPDFSLSLNPASLSLVQGNTVTTTVTQTNVSGYAGTPTLSASGLPNGVTATFTPTTATTTTLTLATTAQAAVGASTVTINGSDGTLSHNASLALTITRIGGTRYHLVIFAGQSNMQGQGPTIQLGDPRIGYQVPTWAQVAADGWTGAPQASSDFPNFAYPLPVAGREIGNSTPFWLSLDPTQVPTQPRPVVDYNVSLYGPELSVMYNLQKNYPNEHFVAVKVSVGGTSVESDWNPATGACYRDLVSLLTNAENNISAAGNSYDFAGMFWYQGENGASGVYDYQHNITTFRTATKTFFNAVRSITDPNLRIVTGRISNSMLADNIIDPLVGGGQNTKANLITATNYRRSEQVRVAQFNADGTPNPTWDGALTNTVWWDNDNLPVLQAGNSAFWYHFTGPGYQAIGERAGTAFQNVFGQLW